jgi:ATP-dependent RNA helicase RhlE
MNSLNLSPNETIYYEYNPEADALDIRLQPSAGATRVEPLDDLPNLAISRDAETGAVVGLQVSSVQQLILQNLVRDLFTLARPFLDAATAAPLPVVAAPEAPAEQPEATAQPEAEPEPVPAEAVALADSAPASVLETEAPTEEAPAKPKRSRRRKAAETEEPAPAPETAPEAVADAETAMIMEAVEALAEPAPARPRRSRRKKAEEPQPDETPAPTEAPDVAAAEEAAPPTEEEPTQPKRSRRSRKQADTPEPVPAAQEEAVAETPAPLEATDAVSETEPEQPAKSRRSRRRKKKDEPETEAAPEEVAPSVAEITTTELADEVPEAGEETESAPEPGAEPGRSSSSRRRRNRRRGKGTAPSDTEAALSDEVEAADEATDEATDETLEPEAAAQGDEEKPARRKRRRNKRRRGGDKEEQVEQAAEAPAPVAQAAPQPPRAPDRADDWPHRSYKTAPIPGLDAPEGFADLKMDPLLGQAIAALGFEEPTPIQRRAVPEALAGKDIIGLAQTGTGKTLAFFIPALHRLLHDPNQQHRPRVLVLVPTRELATQVAEEAEYLATHTDLRITTIYGGVDIGRQIRDLKLNPDVIVATPGRLLDHLNRGNVRLDKIQVLVLDEADRMLDMGFLPEIRAILSRVSKERQTMLYSATMPPAIQSLSLDFQQEPTVIEIARQLPPAAIRQVFFPIEKHLKTPLLVHLFETDPAMTSVLVFTETKSDAEIVRRKLFEAGVSVAHMHGDRSQREREQALQSLRDGSVRVLVATDVAARGLDITGVSHVINYDMPQTVDDYVHRVGRTGRGDAGGAAYSLVSSGDQGMVMRIESALGQTFPREKAEGFDYDVPTPSWAKPSADELIDSLNKPTGIADRFRRMMGGRR